MATLVHITLINSILFADSRCCRHYDDADEQKESKILEALEVNLRVRGGI